MKVRASAPSNIALIKYMGKVASSGNKPTNPSISYTLDHLITQVELEKIDGSEDRWEPLKEQGFGDIELSEKGRAKFLTHFALLKKEMNGHGSWLIRSANNFPSDCGLASSASSFAALTRAAAAAFKPGFDEKTLSKLSRKGSGSSCRSFFTPWAVWEDEGARAADVPYSGLLHAAVIVHAGVKEVSSSDAHVRVATSPKFEGRPERAEQRLRELVSAMRESDWASSYKLIKAEFEDMHQLFESSAEPFRYRNKKSQAVVDACQHIWNFKNDGPWVTMDAGPNVHLLYRPDQLELAEKMVKHFRDSHVVMTSWSGLK